MVIKVKYNGEWVKIPYLSTGADSSINSVYRVKGTVANYNALPTTDVVVGDVYNLEDTGANYVATSTTPTWDKLSETVDLSAYSTTAQNDEKYQPKGNYSTSFADEEDITVDENNLLKFKDKEYSPEDYSGMGRKVLRKHYVNGVNTLTQHMINKPNTIYIIQYDYCLADQTIEIPENCVLQFEGGSLRNGVLSLSDTYIQGAYNSFKSTLRVSGTVKNDIIHTGWFEMPEDDCYQQFKRIVNLSNNSNSDIYFKSGRYVLKNDSTSATIRRSVNFNNSTLVLETNGMPEFDIYISNSTTEQVDSAYFREIENAIKENNKKAEVFRNFKNSCLLIDSNDVELERTNGDVFNRIEYIYVDINGYVYNDFYGEDITISGITKLDCSKLSYIENLNVEINDTFTGEYTGNRVLGFKVYYNSNITLRNITLKDPNLGNYATVFIAGDIGYNVRVENCLLSNTIDNNERSSYVLMMNSIVDMTFSNLKVSNLIGNAWGCTGCNYITNWNILNSNLNRVDVHHRLNNLTIRDSVIGVRGVTVSGYGKIYISNCKFNGGTLLNFREDYGGYFDGDIVLKDIELDSTSATQFFIYTGFNKYDFKVTDPLISNRIRYLGGRNITIDNIIFSRVGTKTFILFREYTTGSYNREKAICANILVKNVDVAQLESPSYDMIAINYNLQDSQIYDKEYPRIVTFDNCKFKPWRQYGNFLMYANGRTYDEYLANAVDTLNTYVYYNNCKGVPIVEFAVNLNVEINNSEITGSAINGTFDSKSRTATGYYNIRNSVINPKDQDLSYAPSYTFPNSATATYNFYNCVFDCEKDVDIDFINQYYMTDDLYENFSGNHSVNMVNCSFGKNFCDLKGLIAGYPIYCSNNYVQGKYETVYNNVEEGSVDCNIHELLKKRIYNIHVHNPGKNGHVYLIFNSSELSEFSGTDMHLYVNTNEGYIHFVNEEREELNSSIGSRFPMLKEITGKSITFTVTTAGLITVYSSSLYKDGTGTLNSSVFNPGTIYYDIYSGRCELAVEDGQRVHVDGTSLVRSGASLSRPTEHINIGFQYFDTTLGKPIYWTGSKWVDATGVEV